MTMASNPLLYAIARQTRIFLINEMKMEEVSENLEIVSPKKLESHHYIVMIGVGGTADFQFIMSFEKNLMDSLTKKFIYGDIDDKDREEVREDIACEVANTVIGMAIPYFPSKGEGITITPPNIMTYEQIMEKNSDSLIYVVDLKTSAGNILTGIILFEERARMKEGVDNA